MLNAGVGIPRVTAAATTVRHESYIKHMHVKQFCQKKINNTIIKINKNIGTVSVPLINETDWELAILQVRNDPVKVGHTQTIIIIKILIEMIL